jgi:hypothetical protein
MDFKLWLTIKIIICSLAIIVSLLLTNAKADELVFMSIEKKCSGSGIGTAPWNKSETNNVECHYICRYYDESWSLIKVDENCNPDKIPSLFQSWKDKVN